MGFVIGKPSMWSAAAVPVLVWVLLLSGTAGGLGFALWRSMRGNVTFTQGLERVLGAMLALVLVFLVAASLAQALSGPALDLLVERRRAALGLGKAPSLPFRETFPRSLGVTLLGLAMSLPFLGLLVVLGMVVPVLAPLFLALKFLIVSLVVAWDFLDYPFAVEGMRLGERVAFMKRHFLLVMGFGMTAALALVVPGVGLVLLPMGVVGATDVLFFGRAASSRYPRKS